MTTLTRKRVLAASALLLAIALAGCATPTSQIPTPVKWVPTLEADTPTPRQPAAPTEAATLAPPAPAAGDPRGVDPAAQPRQAAPARPQGAAPAAACAPPAGWVRYVVAAQDTLVSLAAQTGTTAEQIQQANCLSKDALLFAGRAIYLPSLPPAQASAPNSVSQITPVMPGSTPAVVATAPIPVIGLTARATLPLGPTGRPLRTMVATYPSLSEVKTTVPERTLPVPKMSPPPMHRPGTPLPPTLWPRPQPTNTAVPIRITMPVVRPPGGP